MGVISAMVGKELGTTGIVPRSPTCPLNTARSPGLSPAGDNNLFLLHVAVQSVLKIVVEVEEPEASENPTQSFEIHNIIRRRKLFLTVIIYIILHCKH